MTRWGMFQAGWMRAGWEGLLPAVASALLVWFLPLSGVIQLGIIAIVWSLVAVWAWVWPMYRLRLSRGSVWNWIAFVWLYLSLLYVVNMALEWRLVSTQPALFQLFEYDFSRSAGDYGLYLLLGASTIAIVRGLLHVWRRAASWVEQRLIRQMTVSHIQVLGAVFVIFSLLVLIYLLVWDLPDRIKGVRETEEAARWTAPLLSDGANEKRLNEWLEQVEDTRSPTGFLPAEWFVYSSSGKMLSQSGDSEEAIVRDAAQRALDSNRTQADVVKGEPSYYVVAVPILDEGLNGMGVLVQLRPVQPLESFVLVVLFLTLFMLVSLAVIPVSLVIALVISGVFAYVRSRKLITRFQRVAKAAEEWSRGNLEHRIPPNGRDEVGKLCDQLNDVAVSLAQAQNRLAAEKKQVERLLRSKKEWVSDVSHELRTPVALIHGHLEIMDGKPDSKRLHLIRREVERLRGMIDQLFQLSLSDDGPETDWERKPVAIDKLVAEVGETFAPIAWRERKISLEWEENAPLPPVMGDENRMRQILHNLVRNALRHTPEGGMVRLVAIQESEKELNVRVSDTGSGIHPGELAHIFERRFRGGGQVTDAKGAGIGLALVNEWMEKMGGRVDITSEEGNGTEVVLTFPL